MHIETLVLGELATNCYIVWDESTREAMVIDPADSGDVISQYILDQDLQLKHIILTHGHFDHVLGLLELKLNFSEVPILMHETDVFLLKNARQSALHWLGHEVDPVPLADAYFSEGDTLRLGDQTFTVLETPGHTPGSICLLNDQAIFTGDTLFKDGVGRTDFSYAKPLQLSESLAKIKNLAESKHLFAGHGDSFFLS